MTLDELLSEHRYVVAAALAIYCALLLGAEQIRPLRRRTRRLPSRLLVNAAITATAFCTGALSVRKAALALAPWVEENSFGLIQIAPLPGALKFVAGFLLMDLTFYYWHLANHSIPLLWRFHNVHHIDPDLDVSTSFRFHFVEVLYSTAFRALQVLVLGIAPATYIVYEAVFQCATAFHHSNLALPIRLERLLNRVFVTPRMHGIHHSIVRGETNSNYSVIFRWWDRLHRTLIVSVPQSAVTIGVPGYAERSDNTIVGLLLMPFRRQRNYWRPPDSPTPQRSEAQIEADGRLAE